MVEANAANSWNARKARRGARCIAKHTAEESDAASQTAAKAPKEALPSAKGMVEGSDACFMAVVCALRACTAGPSSAWLMVAARGAQLRSALRAREVERTTVFAMVGAGDAYLRVVERVPRGALISAKLMGVAKGARGAKLGQIWVLTGLAVINLRGESPAFVLRTFL